MVVRRLVLVALLAVAGCGGPLPSAGPTTPAPGTAPTAPVETAPPPAVEDPSRVEGGAGGGGEISVELVGLPVGSSGGIDVDGVWCERLAWNGPDLLRTTVEISEVRVRTPGARLGSDGCDDTPPCAGARIVDGAGSCSVAVTPPTPDTATVEIALVATVRCDRRSTCDALEGHGWYAMRNPKGVLDEATDEASLDPGTPTEPSGAAEPQPPDAPSGAGQAPDPEAPDDDEDGP